MSRLNGRSARFQQVDVPQEEQVAAFLATVVEELGRVDVLVDNTGVEGIDKPTDQLELAEWERVMAVNATAVFRHRARQLDPPRVRPHLDGPPLHRRGRHVRGRRPCRARPAAPARWHRRS